MPKNTCNLQTVLSRKTTWPNFLEFCNFCSSHREVLQKAIERSSFQRAVCCSSAIDSFSALILFRCHCIVVTSTSFPFTFLTSPSPSSYTHRHTDTHILLNSPATPRSSRETHRSHATNFVHEFRCFRLVVLTILMSIQISHRIYIELEFVCLHRRCSTMLFFSLLACVARMPCMLCALARQNDSSVEVEVILNITLARRTQDAIHFAYFICQLHPRADAMNTASIEKAAPNITIK